MTSMISGALRASQLKRLSFLCGLPTTGRKDELIARLALANSNTSPPVVTKTKKKAKSSSSPPVVLSIDLGIKNLAFSLLTPDSKRNGRSSNSAANGLHGSANTAPIPITLHAWRRLSLLDLGPNSDGGGGSEECSPLSAGFFAPAALAITTNNFLQDTILQLRPLPTHILIERQRWRSGGAAAIQEWTVRVNTLEAMLHASLRTLRDLGVWGGEVVPVKPERVGQFFLLGQDQVKPEEAEAESAERPAGKRRTKKTSAESKKAKIDLMSRWLDGSDLVVSPGNVETRHMLDAYIAATKRKKPRPRRSKVADAADISEEGPIERKAKLDDLTDSLMQGIAWLRWQENTSLLNSEGGVEELLK
ncbi:mitochondrial resolvase Ydc2 [Poronia punctata]|nr:mitochondrial resolvase Ydc2 [Poronia punctata]